MNKLTNEQNTILEYCKNNAESNQLVLINAVAGSGKTTMLTAIAREIPNTHSLYLAYNKAIATEASRKFPSSVNCSTTHALAYGVVMSKTKLKLNDNISWRDIPIPVSYEMKLEIIALMEKFFLSKYINWYDFCIDEDLHEDLTKLGSLCIDSMLKCKMPCSHNFYLKVFHQWLANGTKTYTKPFDILMLDEAGDLNEVTLEIFKLLPAKLKIAVGDQHQNIYTFNHTINCFKVLKDIGISFKMSQSFRVAPSIAKQVEKFCTVFLDKDMEFKGTPQNRTIKTKAFIARSNSTIIDKILELNDKKIPYTLTRSADTIFKLPKMLVYLRQGGFISDPAYKFLQDDYEDYFAYDNLQKFYKSPLAYLKHLHGEGDYALDQALGLVLRHGRLKIRSAYEEAKKHEKKPTNYALCTAHSSKGLEFDHVELADDMNTTFLKSIQKIIDPEKIASIQDYENLNLYYVAATRASIQLDNAMYLEDVYADPYKGKL